MANVAVTSDAWTEISITSGTVQNISATADIELSAEQTDNSGVVLKPSELYQWDNATIYARAVTEATGALRVVNFKKAAGGGGSYVLPVASASTLGGVKVGSNLSIDAGGVLSATGGGAVDYSTTEKQIGTWVDGKPLYQITYKTNLPSSSGVAEHIISLDADVFVINISGFIYTSGFMAPVNLFVPANTYAQVWQSGQFIDSMQNGYSSMDAYITIQYTKTTD